MIKLKGHRTKLYFTYIYLLQLLLDWLNYVYRYSYLVDSKFSICDAYFFCSLLVYRAVMDLFIYLFIYNSYTDPQKKTSSGN